MNNLYQLIKDNILGFLIIFVLVFFMFVNYNTHIDEDILCSYVIDYNTGFGGRKLIATIVSSIFKVPTLAQIRIFAYVIVFFICMIFAWLSNQYSKHLYKHHGEKGLLTSLFIIALYLLCPASIMYLLKYPNLGRLDIYLFVSCLIFCILFYHRKKNRFVYFTLTTILFVAAILIHHVFVATYMSFFASLIIYDIWSNGFNRRLFGAYLGLACLSLTIFVSIITNSYMNLSLDEAINYNPNFELSRKFVCFEYYAHISDHIEQYVIPKITRLRAGFILTNIFLLPLILFFAKLWVNLYKNLKTKVQRRLLCGMQCCFLLFIPAFCITVDYPRWFGAFFALQFLLLAYFTFDKHTIFCELFYILQNFLQKNIIFVVFLLVYCSLLEYFYSDTYFQGVEMIIERLGIHRVTTLLPPQYRL